MRLRRVIIGFVVLAVFVAAAWILKKSSGSPFPVEIRCNGIVTSPQVNGMFGAALILVPDGTIWGWGENSGALLGPVNLRGQWNVPRRLDVGSNWVSLATGNTFALGTKADGSLWGWSYSSNGGLKSIGAYTNPPTQLAPGTNWTTVAAGAGHALASRIDGSIWVWGQNDHGQVGDGTMNWLAAPVAVGTNRNWVAVAAGAFASLGLQSDGSLWQWGFVHSGYSKEPDISLHSPTRVDDGTNWVAIFAIDYCYFARQRDGGLWVWGPNAENFLGSTNRRLPFRTDTETNWLTLVMADPDIVCLKQNGTLWRRGYKGLAVPAQPPAGKSVPVGQVGNRADWTAIWTSSGAGFGLTQDGTLWTWGKILQERSGRATFLETLTGWLPRPARRIIYKTWPPGQTKTVLTPWPLVRFTTNSASMPR